MKEYEKRKIFSGLGDLSSSFCLGHIVRGTPVSAGAEDGKLRRVLKVSTVKCDFLTFADQNKYTMKHFHGIAHYYAVSDRSATS